MGDLLEYGHLWAVWYRDHIHTDVHRKLAIFATREEAKRWIMDHGMPGCKIRKLELFVKEGTKA